MFKIGDYVTRKKYDNDIIFIIDKIENEIIYLKGLDVRLYADTTKEDLVLSTIPKKKDDIKLIRDLDMNFFYIPGVILHLDSDSDYLNKCMDYYKSQKLKYYGYVFKEKEFINNIDKLLKLHKPDILVLTGHDAKYRRRKNDEIYKNSKYYIESVNRAREIYPNHEDLVIISGACQSDYEGLIKVKSTFASSPKGINIDALTPALIAANIALYEKTKTIDIIKLLSKIKNGSDAMGGIIINGTMLSGYPRKE